MGKISLVINGAYLLEIYRTVPVGICIDFDYMEGKRFPPSYINHIDISDAIMGYEYAKVTFSDNTLYDIIDSIVHLSDNLGIDNNDSKRFGSITIQLVNDSLTHTITSINFSRYDDGNLIMSIIFTGPNSSSISFTLNEYEVFSLYRALDGVTELVGCE